MIEGKWIERQIFVPAYLSQSANKYVSTPILLALVIIWQMYAIRPIPYPIHKAQYIFVEFGFTQMILYQHIPASDPLRFLQ
jgi:hypothetical protein